MKKYVWLVLLLSVAVSALPNSLWAIGGGLAREQQSYTETLKERYNVTPKPKIDYLAPSQEQKTKPSQSSEAVSQPYIDALKEKQTATAEEINSGSVEKSDPSPPKKGSYIDQLQKSSTLEPKMAGEIAHAAGLQVSMSNQLKVSSTTNQANPFELVYNTANRWVPYVDMFYEWQFLRHKWLGILAATGHLGVLFASGKGVFTQQGTVSDTQFRFFAIPTSVGAAYRFTALRILVPRIEVGALVLPFLETRSDEKPNRKALSRGYRMQVGVSVPLDWISRKDAWSQYGSNAIWHSYLQVNYEIIRTISGGVDFDNNALLIGLSFEF